MKVAIIHEWLVVLGGAELVLKEILELYPDADVFTLVRTLTDEDFPALSGRKVTTSFIDRLPFGRSKYRSFLPLMPLAIEQFDLSEYDLVISSSYAVAKGVITGPNQTHVSYVHSPIRYAWDLQHSYLRESGLAKGIRSIFARLLLHYIRIWDVRTSNNVDAYIANSKYVSRRIKRIYGKEATVIHPPVNTEQLTQEGERKEYYFTTARMVPYKKMPMIARAFSKLSHLQLVIAGDGPEYEKCRAAAGENVKLIGFVTKNEILEHMSAAKAFVYAAEEDFGIVMVEAQAAGTPVIAYAKGGAAEIVANGRSGLLFSEQTEESLIDAVTRFEAHGVTMSQVEISSNAMKFHTSKFRNSFMSAVGDATAWVREL